MEQGQNLSIFEADKLLAQTLSQLRPVYRQALIDVYGADFMLRMAHPCGQHLDGLRLDQLNEELAADVLYMGVEFFPRSRIGGEDAPSEIASALPFIICSLLIVERFQIEHIAFFNLTLAEAEAFEEARQSLSSLTDVQRGVVGSALRAALLCHLHYGLGEGVGDECNFRGADECVADLIWFARHGRGS